MKCTFCRKFEARPGDFLCHACREQADASVRKWREEWQKLQEEKHGKDDA